MAGNKILQSTSGQHEDYAGKALTVWMVTSVVTVGYGIFLNVPFLILTSLVVVMSILMAWHFPKSWKMQKRMARFGKQELEIITDEELKKEMNDIAKVRTEGKLYKKKEEVESIYLGEGFVWDSEKAIRAREIQDEIVPAPKQPPNVRGRLWIHGLSDEIHKLGIPTSHTSGNVSIFGTTGAGKTKYYTFLLKQAILRGEAVVVLDPKGDRELREVLKQTCRDIGTPNRFSMFHPGFPEDSIRLNMLSNFNKPSELASRISSLLPGSKSSTSDVFTDFITNVLTYIIAGMLMVGEKVTLVGISSYVHNGTGELLKGCIKRLAYANDSNWERNLSNHIKDSKNDFQITAGYISYYRNELRKLKSSTEIEGLVNMVEHDRSHFEKMVVSIHPVLTFLTSGDIGALLSPNPDDHTDNRAITDLSRLIESKGVVYIGLDTLSDDKVGNAICSLLLADMAAFAGDRYNYTSNTDPVNLFVDEAGEIMTPALIRILNKARGAGVRTFMATQTFSDYIVSLGSKDAAHQATGNANTVISLRQQDPETQEEVLGSLPTISMPVRQLGRTGQIEGSAARKSGGSVSEKTDMKDIDLISPSLLSNLPDFEYFARLPNGNLIKGRFPLVLSDDA